MVQRVINGAWISSESMVWSVIATPDQVDPGFYVFRTRSPMNTMYLGLTGSEIVYCLSSNGPVDYFSFDRYAQRLGTSETQGSTNLDPNQIWLYSVYGYIEESQVVCLRYRPSQEMEFLILPRPVQFPW
jgi:hypothetical protein